MKQEVKSRLLALAASRGVRNQPLVAYLLSAALVVAAVTVRWVAEPYLPSGYPFLTFFPAVIVATFVGGLGPGIVSGVLGGIAAWYFFIEPDFSFGMDSGTAVALGFYIFVISIDIALLHFMQTTAASLENERRRSDQLAADQRTMFRELQHRVANNMQFLSALIHMQKRQIGADPGAARKVLDDTEERLRAIARLHRRLYDPANANLPVGEFLQELCTDLLDAANAQNIVCLVDAHQVVFGLNHLTTLSLLVVELVTNALKHAFEPTQKGVIKIQLQPLEDDSYSLIVADNGKGFRPSAQDNRRTSLGAMIMQGLAAQLNGQLTYRSEGGTVACVQFKPDDPGRAA